ncbi:VanZ family protein [Propionibacteriaceae bacterium G1746]|uniref:VanZ family protein n=1 Tax=Aestuariimicrobium sp. G57 TaxID=3418485 RepID=UPI003C196D96
MAVRSRTTAAVLLVACAAGALALTLLPIGWQLNRFVVWVYYEGLRIYSWPNNEWITLGVVAAALNVALTVPLAICAAIALPRVPWWVIGIAATVLGGAVELAQLYFPLDRSAQVVDVITNGLGGFIGAGLVAATRWWRHRRAAPVHPAQVSAAKVTAPPPSQ